MKVSLLGLCEWLEIPADGPRFLESASDRQALMDALTLRGLEVEGVENLSEGLDHVVSAKVVEKAKHPQADRLSVCAVFDGQQTFQIVCGAQNFKVGDVVPMAKVGAHLPCGLKIAASEIRGVSSSGMLCAEEELGLAEKSEGLLILPSDTTLGLPIATVLGREDIVLHLNVTPNRGDALSHRGVAAEVALHFGLKVKACPDGYGSPQDVRSLVRESEGAQTESIHIESLADCSQYYGFDVEGLDVGPSPRWLQSRLQNLGLRSISNVVDATNLILQDFGTPFHAFDGACLESRSGERFVEVRRGRVGESLELLDGSKLSLTEAQLVIADGKGPVALAGVMGGLHSEVTEKTTSIFLEAAHFSAVTVRKSARPLGKITDASLRFERKVDGEVLPLALSAFFALLKQLCPKMKIRKFYSAKGAPLWPVGNTMSVTFSVDAINQFLGLSLSPREVVSALDKAGFSSEEKSGSLVAKTKSSRPDVATFEDFAEEVLRVVGYDQVPATLPAVRGGAHVPLGSALENALASTAWRAQVRRQMQRFLVDEGFSESLSFAFTSEGKIRPWLHGAVSLAEISNPLNQDFAHLKPSLLPGLFDGLLKSYSHQEADVRLFECRKTFLGDGQKGVAEERTKLAVMATGRSFQKALGAQDRPLDFFDLKGWLEMLMETLNVRGLRFQSPKGGDLPRFLHPYQSAQILLGKGPVGWIGRLHPTMESEHKIRSQVYLFEMDWSAVEEMAKPDRKAQPLPRFPKVVRDFTFLVPDTLSAEKVSQALATAGRPLTESVQIIDLYRSEKLPPGHHSLTLSMVLRDQQKTLEEGQVDEVCQKILGALKQSLGIGLRDA